jgi:hypothetical protein
MIITIQPQISFDTNSERDRIKAAFSDHKDPMVKQKLLELIDMVEKTEWQKAYEELTLNNGWWQGYDDEDECPRLEYVGTVKHNSLFLNRHTTYYELICLMIFSKLT